jgi:hypothetical protein
MRKHTGIERTDLQLAGESLMALSHDGQKILSVLDPIEPGLLMSLGSSTLDTVVKMTVSSRYTELAVAETTRTRRLDNWRWLSSAHGYSIYADRPQSPTDEADSARVIAARTFGETISDGTTYRTLPLTAGPQAVELSESANPGVEEVIWKMGEFLNSAVGKLTPG